MNAEQQRLVNKTKKAIKEHRTIAACVCTAVIVARITRKSVLETAAKNIQPVLNELYQENESITMQRDFLVDFINSKELGREALAHIMGVKALVGE